MSVRVVYDGPLDAVEVPSLGAIVERGKSIEIDDQDTAEALAAQGDWHIRGAKNTPAPVKEVSE
jgi:hypothetical protein